jgi:transposase
MAGFPCPVLPSILAAVLRGQGVFVIPISTAAGGFARRPALFGLGLVEERGHVRGGRAAVRRVLYLALSAVRYNPALKAFRDRLAARGKKAKVIFTAVARKLLVIANAVIRTGRLWDPALEMAR